VSLAGERTIENYRDILPDARKVISPALYVGAKEDFAAQGDGMDLIKPDDPTGREPPDPRFRRTGAHVLVACTRADARMTG
jgi:hypothetical protein